MGIICGRGVDANGYAVESKGREDWPVKIGHWPLAILDWSLAIVLESGSELDLELKCELKILAN